MPVVAMNIAVMFSCVRNLHYYSGAFDLYGFSDTMIIIVVSLCSAVNCLKNVNENSNVY